MSYPYQPDPNQPQQPLMPGAAPPYGPAYHPPPPPPRSRKAWWIVLGTVGVVVLLCFGGCAVFLGAARDAADEASGDRAQVEVSGPASGGAGGGASPGPVVAAVGQTITVRPWRAGGEEGEVAYTVRAVTRAEPPNEYLRPGKGMYVTVDLEIRVDKGSEFASAGDISFVARDGTVYEATIAGYPDEFDSADLKEGQRKSGLVVFDVPTDALAGAKIQLRSLFDDDAYGYWTV